MGIKIIRNEKLWVEEEAVKQLKKLDLFNGVLDIVGLPDLHPSKVPVGITVKTEKIIYPFLIGNDIGCGMTFFNTNVKLKKLNIKQIIKRLEDTKITGKFTIGGGNHFIELQEIDKIYNQELAYKLLISKNRLHLLVHSGSRMKGQMIYQDYASVEGLKDSDKRFYNYLDAHHEAIDFAKENRVQLANFFMELLQVKYHNQLVIDCIHNYLEIVGDKYYHHKGSISTLQNRYAIIAGSRGSFSYIVKTSMNKDMLFSISHGAGRKWARNLCKGRLVNKYKRDELKTTKLGGVVITNDKTLLYQEAPEAYKNIEDVISVLLEHNCIELIARLKPLVSYKN